MNKSPVYNIKAVPVEKIVANDYNPNTVASPEMKLLYDSIKEDGYTMPIVCYYMVYFVKKYLDQQKTGNVIVVNIKE